MNKNDATTPILTRLGDFHTAAAVFVPKYGNALVGENLAIGDRREVTLFAHDTRYLPVGTLVHRLIPETAATRYAEEMLALLTRRNDALFAAKAAAKPLSPNEPDYSNLNSILSNLFAIDKEIDALLSRIDAAGGAA